MKQRICALLAALVLSFCMTGSALAVELPFDPSGDHWLYDPQGLVSQADSARLEETRALYAAYAAAAEPLRGATVDEHRRVTDTVFETVYTNGAHVLVNYGTQAFTAGGHTAEAGGYAVWQQRQEDDR